MNAEYCTLCGRPATAHRTTPNGTIALCEHCALEHLPGLVADAIPLPDWNGVKRIRDKIELRYMRAMVFRLLKEREGRR
jgi:hypothetical protein